MKKILVTLLLAAASIAQAGGSIGGGTGLIADSDVAVSLAYSAGLAKEIDIPDLGIQKKVIGADLYRRVRARLETSESTSLMIDGKVMEVKPMKGGIVDIQEQSQFLIEM